MTAKERVLASRIIEKIDNNEIYTSQIGLSYAVSTVGANKNSSKPIQGKEKRN